MSKFIAIDLEPQGLFVAAGSARAGHAKVEHAITLSEADGEAPPALSAETAKRIGEQLKDRLRAAGIVPAAALVSVGRDRVILKELKYPKVPPVEEPNVVRFQAMKELSDSPDDVVLDYAPLTSGTTSGGASGTASGAADGEQRSMAVVLRKDVFAAIQSMCNAAGLKATVVTVRPYAVVAGLTRSFAAGTVPGPESKAEAVAAITLGPGGGEFTVFRAGEVSFTKSIGAPALASEPMLVAEIRRNLTVYAGQNPGHPVQAVYVAEAGSRWSGRLRAALGLPVHAYDPLAGSAPDVPETLRGRFAGAAGLLAGRAADALPINFASPRQPRPEKDPAQAQIILAALITLIVLAIGGFFGWRSLGAADDRLAKLQKEKADLTEQLALTEPDAKRLAAVRGWQGRRVIWLDELFDMTDRFPAADKFYAASFIGRAVLPDAKTGKQDNQAVVEVKVVARDPAPVNTLLTGIESDNIDPKTKFYVGTNKTTGGPAQGDPAAREYVVFARVNNRQSATFTRAPAFTPPSRTHYPPPAASAKEPKEDPRDKEPVEKEPTPKDKTGAE